MAEPFADMCNPRGAFRGPREAIDPIRFAVSSTPMHLIGTTHADGRPEDERVHF